LRRLYPALIIYVLILLPAMWWLQHLPDLPRDSDFPTVLRTFPRAMFYLINYFGNHGTSMCYGHLWSLGCEMQFYLLGPLIFLAGGSGHRRRMIVYGVLLAILLVLGTAQPVFALLHWNFKDGWDYRFEFAVWPMMAGFFCEYRRDWFSRLSGRLVSIALWSSAVFCA
jgi:peptidoglycan/LPS O-acetylase OafA/YrhL